MKRRDFSISAAAMLALGVACSPAAADDFPSKPITLMIPFGAGGSHDMHARMISSTIQEYLGQPVIVKMMPGAGGTLAMGEAAKAKADGYTLMFTHNYLDQLTPLISDVNYSADDFVGVAQINASPNVVWTSPKTDWHNLGDVVGSLAEDPGGFNVGYTGLWDVGFTPIMMFLQKAGGLEANWVPFDGGGSSVIALLSGDVDLGAAMMAQTREHYEAGTLVPLGVTSKERDPSYPDVPTFTEQGFDVDVSMSRIILAPADTPPERVEILSNAFAELMEDKSFLRLITSANSSIQFQNTDELEAVRERQKREFNELVAFTKSLEGEK